MRNPGGDFYSPRAQLDLVTYSETGKLIAENVNDFYFPFHQLLVNLPSLDGYREVRAIISDDYMINVSNKSIVKFETRIADNGLDEEYVELKQPSSLIKNFKFSIKGDGEILKVILVNAE